MSNYESLEQIRARYEADRQRNVQEAREQAEYAEASKVLFDQAGTILRAHGELKTTEGWRGHGEGVYGVWRVTLHYRETPLVTLPTDNDPISLSISEKPSEGFRSDIYYIKGLGIDPLDDKQEVKTLFTLESQHASDWNEQPLSPEMFGNVGDLLRDIQTALVAENNIPKDHLLESLGFDGEDLHFHLRQAGEEDMS